MPCGTWNLPGPGIEPVSPELAGRFLITGPSGKFLTFFFFVALYILYSEEIVIACIC